MWRNMIFSQSPDDPCRVLVPAAIAEEIDQFRQEDQFQYEAGGLLLGLRRGPHIEVVKVTTPMAGDIRTRTSFLRRAPGHFEVAQRLWLESNGTIGYVGEWHTHPEPWPLPSRVDTAEWRKVLRLEQRLTVFVIVGTANWFVARGPIKSSLRYFYPKWEQLTITYSEEDLERI